MMDDNYVGVSSVLRFGVLIGEGAFANFNKNDLDSKLPKNKSIEKV